MELISVIVPVYNDEPYLCRCVDSIIAQSCQNIEIILVDDGSTDQCGEICDRYAAMDSRISAIHKRHGGPGSARNAAFRQAKGEYIGFVDADDYVAPTMYESLYLAAVKNNADIVQTGIIRIRPDGVIINPIESTYSIFFTPSECLFAYLCQRKVSDTLVNKLCRRRVLESLPFVEEYLYEDVIDVLHLLLKCQKFVALESADYFNLLKPNSVTRGSAGRWHLESMLHVPEMVRECILTNVPQYRDEVHRSFCVFSVYGYRRLKRVYGLLPNEKSKYRKEFIDRFKRYYKPLRKTHAYESMTFKEKTAFALFRIHPELCCYVYKIFRLWYYLKPQRRADTDWNAKSEY